MSAVIERVTPYQENRALMANKVGQDFQLLDSMLRESRRPSILAPYLSYDPDTKTAFEQDYNVTPGVLFGIYIIKRSLIADLLKTI